MRKGSGIAIALLLLTVGITYWVNSRMENDAKHAINGPRAEQLKAANELIAQQMNAACEAYFHAKQKLPERAEDLVPEFMAAIPNEGFSGLSKTVSAYDGSGGWVYEAGAFRPNDPQKPNVE